MNFRLILFVLAILLGSYLSYPSLTQSQEGKKISLGLDLQGGMYMLLGVKTEEAIKTKIKTMATSVKYFTDKNSILIDDVTIDDYSFSFVLLDPDEKNNLEEKLNSFEGVLLKTEEQIKYNVSLTPEEQIATKKWAVSQAVETIRNRLDQFGLAEPSVTKQGEDSIVIELPGIKTQKEEQAARELISKPAKLELMAVSEEDMSEAYNLTTELARIQGLEVLEDTNNPNYKYVLKQIPILTGDQVKTANVGFDQQNRPLINFSLDSLGSELFADFTEKNVGKRLAIVLDKKVFSAPKVNGRIGGGSAQITGNFTIEEAGSVAIALRSGSLPAPVEMLEKRSVGPSLGQDSINSSALAMIVGYILVLLFMIVYYRFSGLVATFALVTNLLLIIAIMAMFGATLTLPGMAGLVLTIGMAVDANVIINERIRELLKQGMSMTKSIQQGYANAMSAIVDANITTILTAIILYAYGTGPIKGFALTMSIGILVSMFTAIVCTYGVYSWLLPKMANKSKHWYGV